MTPEEQDGLYLDALKLRAAAEVLRTRCYRDTFWNRVIRRLLERMAQLLVDRAAS